ncbi:ClbS/DfsB family four-helix bundle protein [Rodentibacter haemolyticus]|uniref:ClbS/DfsB family four-helix bundle protein n=1 Tax=Rodentibacter haemolyticus TaxID=2778911 RepID=A0ABX6UXE7_9PAST|nr:ClbS/DfsB family four-helix bundle protein [Rodentibacter haemolyticus]QPB42775.1 ClbS/DfsB family four-helix bundle protein [Rodentibacter haemolyticus]
MAVPINKTELEQAIRKNYQQLQKELAGISADVAHLKTMEGHNQNTLMSVCDLLAYLLGWGELVLKWERLKTSRQPVDFPETGYKWNELGKLAQKFYADYADLSFEQLKSRLDDNHQQILVLIDSKTNAELYEQLWYTKWTQGRMIQFNTASPYANAKTRLRKWKKSN